MEKKAVKFFVKLLRGYDYIETCLAHSFLQGEVAIRDHLRENYSLKDLDGFFQKHPAQFQVKYGLVALSKAYQAVSNEAPSVSSLEDKIEKEAVDFYVNLLSTNQYIPTCKAHSYLQSEVVIRDHLRENYTLRDLDGFFRRHPAQFQVGPGLVVLSTALAPTIKCPPPVASPTIISGNSKINIPNTQGSPKKSPQVVVPQNTNAKLNSFKQLTIDTSSNSSKSSSCSFMESNSSGPPPAVVAQSANKNLKNSKLLTVDMNNSSSHRKTSRSSSRESNSSGPPPAIVPQSTNENLKTSKQLTVDMSNSSTKNNNTNSMEINSLDRILSMVMSHSCIEPARTSCLVSDKDHSQVSSKKFQDAACQTISTGPVLSLNAFQENRQIDS